MHYSVDSLQHILSSFHINHKIINNEKLPFYLPLAIVESFEQKPQRNLTITFNEDILFAQIWLNTHKRLIIGPLTTKPVVQISQPNPFNYLSVHKEEYNRLKSEIYYSPIFEPKDFHTLVKEWAKDISSINTPVLFLQRNNYEQTKFYQQKSTSNNQLSYLHSIEEIDKAISLGDSKSVIALITDPYFSPSKILREHITSPKEIQADYFGLLASASQIALISGVNFQAINSIHTKYASAFFNSKKTFANIHQLILDFVLEFTELVRNKKNQIDDPLIQRIYNYVADNYQTTINRNIIAKSLNLSPSYLSTYFKQKTGETLTHYIQKTKAERAKTFLTNDKLSISQISDLLGISNVTYFNRIFKKITGQTPTQYRATH